MNGIALLLSPCQHAAFQLAIVLQWHFGLLLCSFPLAESLLVLSTDKEELGFSKRSCIEDLVRYNAEGHSVTT